MNRLILGALAVVLVTLSCVAVGGSGHSATVDDAEWRAYKLEYGKQYATLDKETKARAKYARNKHYIEQFNADETSKEYTFRLQLNQFSDRVDHFELKSPSHNHYPQQRPNTNKAQQFVEATLADTTNFPGDIPKEVDWRQAPGRVSGVKDQGKCHSGWAFAAAGILEGQEKVRVNKSLDKVIDLSAQNLIDCGQAGIGCHVAFLDGALFSVKHQGGILAEADAPYEGQDQRECHFDRSKSVITTTGPGYLPAEDPEKLVAMVAKYGPVGAQIAGKAASLLHYAGGVYNDPTCGHADLSLYHSVLIVGYGTDPKDADYWLVKNSWGPKWGEQGYIRIARNEANICGITSKPVIATF